mgnify:CR=1 FL=1
MSVGIVLGECLIFYVYMAVEVVVVCIENHPVRRSGGHPSFVRRGVFGAANVVSDLGIRNK